MTEKVFKMRLQKGDLVIVTTGKDKGKTGKITATFPKENKVTVEKVNVVKRATKPNRQYPQGGIVEFEKPIDVSNVAFYDEAKKSPSRIGFKVSDDKKVRISKKSGKEIK